MTRFAATLARGDAGGIVDFGFDITFEEAWQFAKNKLAMTRADFNLLLDEKKRLAFTVAKVSSMDVLVDLKAAVDDSIGKGQTLAEFGKLGWKATMDRRGWTGTTPWHMETVFRTNAQSNFGAGRWKEHQDVVELYPYGTYEALLDGRERKEHGDLNEKTYRMDSAFWHRHYPPWDYNCRCSCRPTLKEDVRPEDVSADLGPEVKNDFTSPAFGAAYEPDLSKYTWPERQQLEDALRE